MSQTPAMSSPQDYRELMAAVMKFGTTDTVEEVLDRHKRREDERQAKDRATRPSVFDKGRPGTPSTPNAVNLDKVRQSEIDKVRALLAENEKRRQQESTE